MGRAILSVIAGYLAMFAVVFVTLTAAYLAMGADRAFQPGSYELTPAWIAVWAAVTVLAAVIGGLVAGKIARTMTPVWVLIGLVLVLGGAQAIGIMVAPEPPPEARVRSPETSNLEAMASARQPVWVAVLNPLIGAAGVLVGARLARKPASRSQMA